jgi:hypothetical protein
LVDANVCYDGDFRVIYAYGKKGIKTSDEKAKKRPV